MRDMDLNLNRSEKRDVELLQTLLKYKKSYVQLCNDIANFYSFNRKGEAVSVDAQALAEFLKPFAEQLNKGRY